MTEVQRVSAHEVDVSDDVVERAVSQQLGEERSLIEQSVDKVRVVM